MLPRHVHAPGEAIATITAEAAARTGLPADCLICAGTTGLPSLSLILHLFCCTLRVGSTAKVLAECKYYRISACIGLQPLLQTTMSPLTNIQPNGTVAAGQPLLSNCPQHLRFWRHVCWAAAPWAGQGWWDGGVMSYVAGCVAEGNYCQHACLQ